MTDQPAVGPLGAEDVKLLKGGDLLRHPELRAVVRFECVGNSPGYIRHSEGHAPFRYFAFIGRPIDADGWIEHDGSDRNPLPGEKVDARGSKFVLEPTARSSEEIRWDRVRFWRPASPAPTAHVETLGPAAAVAADVVRGEPDDDLKLVIAHTIIEELRAQHPGIEQIDNERGDVWLPGGSTPQSSGCIVDIHSVAQSVEQQVLAALRPGHTDLMVSPKSIDAFLEANPLPDNTGGEVEATERGPITHDVKCWPGPFDARAAGLKPWELRANDRDYRVGDFLRQRRFDPERQEFTGEVDERPITWALYGPAFGLPAGQVIMTLGDDTLRPQPTAPSVDLAELKRLHAEAVKHLGGPNLKADSYGLQVWGESKKGGHSHVLDVRGWGELTGLGHGALGLSEDEGRAAQRARQAYLVAAWNAVPALIAQIERGEG